ncbi:MAG: 16S rRNA (adenine(1518)-N(6)/adenine(1519)-N(6))-dimethyltransferase RsmA [Desulfuromonadales bacterium]|nr:16S rRNA (adenine(1518)-N(6)/adenine(1519)-N(6))-dimethyltransferase RsmA [Desulfuromonadales bacterium]
MKSLLPDHRPRKRFGQNFLRAPHVVEKILAAAELTPGERVVEIGPGLGALTDRLLENGALVTAFEVDRDLAAALERRDEAMLTVCLGDVLKSDWPALLPEPPYKLVANLPYNISSQVLFKILDHRPLFGRLVLMFQKEVGDRLLAAPATRDYGILSVLVQNWFEVTRVVKVAPGCFHPPPKVDSVVLHFEPRPRPLAPVTDEAALRRLVKAVFAQRRKTLRNGLLGAGYEADAVDRALANLAIPATCRGETLTITQMARLADELG